MPYPATISNTATYPRAKNSVIGAFSYDAAIPAKEQLTYAIGTAGTTFGAAAGVAKTGISFIAPRDFLLGSVFIPVQKSASPADNVQLEIWSDDGGSPGLPDTLLASSTTVAGSTLLTTSILTKFDFTSSAISLVNGTRYHLAAKRTGAVNGLAFYKWSNNATLVDPDDYQVSFNSTSGLWLKTAGTINLAYQINEAGTRSAMTTFLSDEATNLIEAWCSYDQGQTWAVRDPFHSRAMSTTAAFKAFEATLESVDVVHVGFPSPTSPNGDSYYFQLEAQAWKTAAATNLTSAPTANVSGACPFNVEIRASDGGNCYAFQGAVEAARRRIKLHRRIPGLQSTFDIITGTTGTLPGTAIDYDLRWMIEGGSSDALCFWTQSDLTTLQFRRFKSDDTFGTIVAIPGTTLDPTAPYAVGIGCIYLDAGVKYVAVPYHDTALGGIAVARCIASGVDTGANWSTALAISRTPETTVSNPCVLGSDGGKKLWLWVVDSTDRKLLYANDAGIGVWTTPDNWKATQTYAVAALSMRVLTDRIMLVYLDDAVTPARVKCDQLFF